MKRHQVLFEQIHPNSSIVWDLGRSVPSMPPSQPDSPSRQVDIPTGVVVTSRRISRRISRCETRYSKADAASQRFASPFHIAARRIAGRSTKLLRTTELAGSCPRTPQRKRNGVTVRSEAAVRPAPGVRGSALLDPEPGGKRKRRPKRARPSETKQTVQTKSSKP